MFGLFALIQSPTFSFEADLGNFFNKSSEHAVLRIRDILGRIRIRRSMPLTNGSGSGSCYFRH
jgi:hypothetical protein